MSRKKFYFWTAIYNMSSRQNLTFTVYIVREREMGIKYNVFKEIRVKKTSKAIATVE